MSEDPTWGQTPSQTVGPFFSIGVFERDLSDLVGAASTGQLIRLEGRLLDGAGAPVPDGLLEIWQSDEAGCYRHPADPRSAATERDGFLGFGRCGTDPQGWFRFRTVKPGSVAPGSAPHLSLVVFARGMLLHACTRIYFEGDPANTDDPVLALVPPDRRATLLARRITAGAEPTYLFDVILQGEGETVFFDV